MAAASENLPPLLPLLFHHDDNLQTIIPVQLEPLRAHRPPPLLSQPEARFFGSALLSLKEKDREKSADPGIMIIIAWRCWMIILMEFSLEDGGVLEG